MIKALPWDSNIPDRLNGYPVIAYYHHAVEQGYVTVLMDACQADRREWIVATWWPELGTRWQWGHYYDNLPDADAFFKANAARVRRNLAGRLN